MPCALTAVARRFLILSDQTPLGVLKNEGGAEGAVWRMACCNDVAAWQIVHMSQFGIICRALSHIVIPDTDEGAEEGGCRRRCSVVDRNLRRGCRLAD